MVPSKAVFLDNSSCVAPPQKHVRKDARLTSGRVRGTLRAFFFLLRMTTRGGKLQHATITTRVQVAVATCVQDMGPRRKHPGQQ